MVDCRPRGPAVEEPVVVSVAEVRALQVVRKEAGEQRHLARKGRVDEVD